MSDPAKEWAGGFGNDYTARSPGNLEANTAFFARALRRADPVGRVLELGAGSGMNLRALGRLFQSLWTVGLEVNPKALNALQKLVTKHVIGGVIPKSVNDWCGTEQFDLVLTKGFLIHVPPEDLPDVYGKIITAASHYVLICEYYNPTPVELEYRGRKGMLWKRDFAAELMAASFEGPLLERAQFRLVDYGFAYHADPKWPQDDITYFLLERGVA